MSDDGFSYALHYINKYIRSYMRLCVIEYALGRAVLVERAQYPADAHIAYACTELAVGKRSGSALAELDVALGVKLTACTEGFDLFSACFGIGAALEHNRL